MRIRLSLYRRTPSFHSLYGLLWWTAFVWSGIGRGYAFFCPQPNDKRAMSTEAKPFLKWAGGKGQLLSQLSEHLPERISKEPFTYIEPFVGGGAMLFYMLQYFGNIRKAVINDVNEDLILTYRIIKCDVEALIANLDRLEKDYLAITDQNGRSQISSHQRYCSLAPFGCCRRLRLFFSQRKGRSGHPYRKGFAEWC